MSDKYLPISELLGRKKIDSVVSQDEESKVPSVPPTDSSASMPKASLSESSKDTPVSQPANQVPEETLGTFLEVPTKKEPKGMPQTVEKKAAPSVKSASMKLAPENPVDPLSRQTCAPAPIPFEKESHPVVLMQHLTKKFGDRDAISGVSLAVLEGHVLGVLGPNGAGKTTLLRLLEGLIRPSAGRIEIDGRVPSAATKAMVSYLPDHSFLRKEYSWKKIRKIFAKHYRDFDVALFDAMSERLHLEKKKKVRDLSKGMKKRLEIALILSRRARLYLLDEPLTEIDPASQDTIFDLMVEALGEKATMVIVTHQIREMERLFDEVCFLEQGRVVRYGAAEQIRMEEKADMEIVFRRMAGREHK